MTKSFLSLGLLTMLSCRACESCVSFTPEYPDDERRRVETDEPLDTVDSALPVDTAPPPPCDFPEEEPNDALTTPNIIEREYWACGSFQNYQDYDWLEFSGDEASWFKVQVRAAQVGSPANVSFYLIDDDYQDAVTITGSNTSEDPWIVFPTLGADNYLVQLYEEDMGYGEDYEWELRASETKLSIEWNRQEEEPNGEATSANDLQEGDVVFGYLDEAADRDWFHVVAPEEKSTLVFKVEAYGSGSPVISRLVLYDSAVLDDPDTDWLERAFTDEGTYDRDPNLEYSTSEPQDLYLLFRWSPQRPDDDGPGGPYYWYTLEYTIEDSG